MTIVVMPTYTSTTALGYEVLVHPPPKGVRSRVHGWCTLLRFAPAVDCRFEPAIAHDTA